MPATVGSDTDEDWSLRQSDTHDTFERDEFCTGLGPFEVGCHALGECYNARDTDTRGYRLDDGNSQRDRAQLVLERTHGSREDPFEEVDHQFHRKDLKYPNPEDLIPSAVSL